MWVGVGLRVRLGEDVGGARGRCGWGWGWG